MRIANSMMTRNYLLNINNNLSSLNETSERLQTGREFTKMSDNVSAGTRALNTRTQLYKNEQLQVNIQKAGESLEVAETNLMTIEDILNSVREQTIKAVNGTNESASHIYEISFSSIKNQIIEFANCKYNDTYVLGGTNNKKSPFEVVDGELQYNGVNVNDITKENGVFSANGEKVPYSDSIYLDIGLGLSVKNGVVDPRSAMNMSVSGLDALGYGTSEMTYQDRTGAYHTIEVPNNAYELINEMEKTVAEKDFDKLIALNDHLKVTVEDLVTEIADVGIRTKYLENHFGRMGDEEFCLTEIQTNLEFVDDTKEIIAQKTKEYTWMLTLQYGGKVIPQSLMDYMR
jgi:flagellar hook-associated protein 3 FlgL